MYNFNEVPKQNNIRTKFKDRHSHKTTGNTGDIIPIYWKEILPGDIVKMRTHALIKMTTPNYQTMDNIFCDIQYYFVPRRLVWEHWKAFQGERTVGPHEVQPEYTVPRTYAPAGGWKENTIADYFGVPTKVDNAYIDSCYPRAYCLIWNEFFRDQNRQDFTDFVITDADTTGSNGSNYITDPIGCGKCLKAAKLHDYFTSSLLTPTGREQVLLPLGESAPVVGIGIKSGTSFATGSTGVWETTNNGIMNASTPQASTNIVIAGQTSGAVGSNNRPQILADLSQATAATVNQLRLAFQLQKIFEANNRSGSRYIETLKNRWNVTPSDAMLQRPEYLGGKRIPLQIDMVLQTGSTNETSPLGQVSGFSSTYDEDDYFEKGFEEHGILMGLAIIRHNRTYQQGLSKFFSRRNMEQFLMPEFQNLGEVAILNKEIYFTGTDVDEEVFGYQEYGAEYRSTPNRVSGGFRSNATNSFDNWHYADNYSTTPVNGEEWIVENGSAVDRTLTVTSEVANQFYFDFYFDETNIRTIPPHSVPGFIDHH